MTTLRTLGTPRPDGPDARDRPKLFISSRCCCCWSGRPSHPHLLPGPGERSLEPTPGPGKARALACDGRSAKARPAGVDLYLLFREAPPHLPGLGDVSMQMTPSPTPGTGGHPSAPQPPSHRLHTPHPPWEGPTLHTL